MRWLAGAPATRDTWMPLASSDAIHCPSRLMARARASRPPGRAWPAGPGRRVLSMRRLDPAAT